MKNIVSYGGGTQSTAMILMALEGKFNLPRPDFGVYADTGGEPEFINEYVRYFIDYVKQKYDFDIFITQQKKGLVYEQLNVIKTSKNGKSYTSAVPPYYTLSVNGKVGMLNRQCSTEFKAAPNNKFINSKLERGEKYNFWYGISFDERSRMKVSTIKRRTNYYPLVDNFLRRIDGINFVNEMGLKPPQRSSCYFCPFHSNRYWQWLKDNHSNEFDKAVDFEKKIQARQNDYNTDKVFLHRECKPLDQIQFENPDQLNMFPELIDECGGECGI